jgi:dienelactone hydrolase
MMSQIMQRRNFMQLTGGALASMTLPADPVIAQRAVPKSEYDYVDWSWERWRAITRASRPTIVTEQTGKAELTDILIRSGEKITTTEQWKLQREALKGVLEVFLGKPPKTKPVAEARIIEETIGDNHTIRRLLYQTEPREFVPALLLIPRNTSGRAPVVICPHQTTQAGKREPSGLVGNPQLHTALHLVKRGYVTFTYDALCFGERHDSATGHYGDAIPFYRKHPHWSVMGKMMWDFSRAIDYLQSLDFVDSTRIGSIGHSHGGYSTLFAMAFDDRIVAGVSNCGFDTFRIDGNTWRWSRATPLLPLLGFYVTSPHLNMDFYRAVPDSGVVNVPFDLHQLLALIAPRALLLSTSDDDFVFPNGGWSARRALARVEPLYDLLGAQKRVSAHFFKGGHNFPADVSAIAYDWLDRQLRP